MMSEQAPHPRDYSPASVPASSLTVTKVVWYRRPWVLLTAALIVVVGVSIISDLPHHITRAEDISAQNASLVQINGDIKPCDYAVSEAFSFYREDLAHQLTPADRAAVPGQLVGDQTACTFASGPMYDLTNNFQAVDTRAGLNIDHLEAVAVSWVSASALGAIEDIQYLFAHPGNAHALRNLHTREINLARQRARARADLARAESILGTTLTPIDLPSLPAPSQPTPSQPTP
ncbi:MAG: hypothetical protein ACP5PB_04900 [Acidimicrobiales bacterium]